MRGQLKMLFGVGLVSAATVLCNPVAMAHHSFAAIFDETRELQVTGVLSRVRWINPHSYFEVEVTSEDGSVQTWEFENFPPSMLRGLGMERSTMEALVGKKVTVSYNPAHVGGTLGYGRVFQFEDGPHIVFTAPSY